MVFTIPTLQMGKLRHQEVKQPSQGPYTGGRKVLDSVLPDSKVFNIQTDSSMYH